METALTFLLDLQAYPVPVGAIKEIALRVGLNLEAPAADVVNTKEYTLAKSEVYLWLSTAPNVTQGGQSYSFSDEDRKRFANLADSLKASVEGNHKPRFGYKGSQL